MFCSFLTFNSAREVINCRYILINNTCALILYTLYSTVLRKVYEKTQKTLPCTNLNTEALHTIFAYKNIFSSLLLQEQKRGMFFYHFVQSSVMIKDFTIFCQNLVTFHSFSVFREVFRLQIYVISHLQMIEILILESRWQTSTK